MSIDIERIRERLVEERQRVLDALDNIRAENPGSLGEEIEEPTYGDNHPGDVATATFDREMASTLEENSSHMLAEIDEERLEALPWATLCIDDKRRQERG